MDDTVFFVLCVVGGIFGGVIGYSLLAMLFSTKSGMQCTPECKGGNCYTLAIHHHGARLVESIVRLAECKNVENATLRACEVYYHLLKAEGLGGKTIILAPCGHPVFEMNLAVPGPNETRTVLQELSQYDPHSNGPEGSGGEGEGN